MNKVWDLNSYTFLLFDNSISNKSIIYDEKAAVYEKITPIVKSSSYKLIINTRKISLLLCEHDDKCISKLIFFKWFGIIHDIVKIDWPVSN